MIECLREKRNYGRPRQMLIADMYGRFLVKTVEQFIGNISV